MTRSHTHTSHTSRPPPNRDLPVIFEVSTPTGNDEVSLAFTLDGVGFDEESGSILTTPPSRESIHKQEKELHRETCRQLGIPFSEDGQDGRDGQDGHDSHDGIGRRGGHNGGINSMNGMNDALSPSKDSTLSSSSSDTSSVLNRKQSHWPWPEAGKDNGALYDVPLDSTLHAMNNMSNRNHMNNRDNMNNGGQGSIHGSTNTNGNSTKKSKSRILNRAKLSEMTSSYTNMIKDAAASLSTKSRKAFDTTKRKYITDGINCPPNKKNKMSSKMSSKWSSIRDIRMEDYYPDWFKNADPLLKLTAGTAFLFVLLCLIVIIAVVGSRNRGDNFTAGLAPPIGSGDGEQVGGVGGVGGHVPGPSSGSSISDALESVTRDNDLSSPSQHPTYITSIMPTYSPTTSPIGMDGPTSGTSPRNEACIDKSGSFQTHRGKSRMCQWLTNHDTTVVTSDRLVNECGSATSAPSGEEASELGRNCGFSCRAYNGCLEAILLEEEEKIVMVHPAPDFADPTGSPTHSPTNVPTFYPTLYPTLEPTGAPSGRPTRKPSPAPMPRPEEEVEQGEEEERGGGKEITAEEEDTTTTFIDINGRERPCTWLDIRNWSQRQIRREENCITTLAQNKCLSSCEDYSTTSLKTSDVSDINSIVMTAKSDTSQLTRLHDPVPQDTHESQEAQESQDGDCLDPEGYYLNHHGHPKPCSWLLNHAGEMDQNCGTSEKYPVATDLGLMCRKSCGTCSLSG